jgi:hypothetical protein
MFEIDLILLGKKPYDTVGTWSILIMLLQHSRPSRVIFTPDESAFALAALCKAEFSTWFNQFPVRLNFSGI